MPEINDNKRNVDPFVPTQPVWLIDSSPVESDKIRAQISPKVININNFDDLPQNLSARLQSDPQAFGTIIISNNLPANIKLNLSSVVSALNNDGLNKRLFIYHITDKDSSPFNNATICSDIDEFISLANNVHIESIATDDVVDEEARRIINKLKIQNGKLTKINDSLKKQLDDKNKGYEELIDSLNLIKKSVTKYEYDKKHAEEKEKIAINETKKLKEENEVLNTEIDKNKEELLNKDHQLLEKDAKINGLSSRIEELNTANNQLEQDKIDLENDLNEERSKSQMYLESKSELSALSSVKDDYNSAKELLRSEKSKNNKLESTISAKNEKIKSLEDKIEQLRKNDSYSNELGYDDPNVYQVINLNRTKVIYFKIIDPIPYHKFYIEYFADFIRKMTNRRVITMMIKVDQGKDQQKYSDRTFIGALDAIHNSTDKYNLIPSKRMGEGTYEFESTDEDKVLIVMDYIQNDKFYVNTQDVYDHYIIINHSDDAQKIYNLSGKIISNDRKSIADWKFNRQIKTQTTKNKEILFNKAIEPIVINSQVILSDSDEMNKYR